MVRRSAGRTNGDCTIGLDLNLRALEVERRPATSLRSSGQRGRIEVFPAVVGVIAAHAATACYGVMGMSTRGLRDGVATLLRRENLHRGVEVELREDGVVISLFVIVEYGTRVSEVAHNLANAVRYSIEKTLGLNVVEVNVNVQGVHVSG